MNEKQYYEVIQIWKAFSKGSTGCELFSQGNISSEVAKIIHFLIQRILVECQQALC